MEEEQTYTCPDCGYESGTKEQFFFDGEEIIGCSDCSSVCEDCGDIVSNENITCLNCERYVCDSCLEEYIRCSDCGAWILYDDSISVEGGDRLICESCQVDHYRVCDQCGYEGHIDDMLSDEYNWYCESCYQEHEDDMSESIRSYSYKPDPKFHNAENEAYGDNNHFGLEIETDTRDGSHDDYVRSLKVLSDREHYFYLKEDGSLSNKGVEVVTHPGTLAYWYQTDILKKICRTARENGYLSHDIKSCGYHIHASRGLFGQTTVEQDLSITKMIILFDRFWDEILKISRRSKASMDDWASKYGLEKPSINEVKIKSNHYRVINLTYHTVELRMFKGTLKYSSLMAGIEFYSRIIEFCRITSLADVLSVDFNTLRLFLESGTEYLSEYLTKRLGAYHAEQTYFGINSSVDIESEYEMISEQIPVQSPIIEPSEGFEIPEEHFIDENTGEIVI